MPEADSFSLSTERTRPGHLLALAAALLLAIGLHFYRLADEGFGNLYYAAAVKSMLESWHNFFFVSFDPAGFVSVDKPPLGLWVQAASAKLLGLSGWSLMLPQALAGVLSTALLYYLVRRVYGPTAGVLAALVLALTPISVAANRNNTMDSQLVFTSLLAAWAVSLAVERGKLRWLLLCAALVGVGFNIKMLQAFLVLPAFFLLYLIAAPVRWWKRLLHLTLATALLLAVSLAWPLAVDLTPPDQRPYVGSSQNNTVMELILGHNGAARLGALGALIGLQVGPGRAGGPADAPGGGGPPPGAAPGQPFPGGPNRPPLGGQGAPPPGGGPPLNPPGQPFPGAPGGPPPGGATPQLPSAPRGLLAQETGQPGPLRLFNEQLGGQASWLLPLAGVAAIALAWQRRWRWPLHSQQQGLLLWGVWLAPQVVFFSYAGLFHRYYLEMLSPAIAALVGAGLVAMLKALSVWRDYRGRSWRGWLLPFALLLSVIVEAHILSDFPEWSQWLTPVVVGAAGTAAMALLLLRFVRRDLSLARGAATGIGMLGLLVAPAVWALTPVLAGGDAGLPYAGPSLFSGGRRLGGMPDLGELADYLTSNWRGERYFVAALNANSAAPIILQTDAPAIALGGFSGGDQILSAEGLSAVVSAGELRFFLLPEQGGQQAELTEWVSRACARVPKSMWMPIGPGGRIPWGPGGPMELYDCAKPL